MGRQMIQAEAGYDCTWMDTDDFKVGYGANLVPFYERGQ
jgi:hypothetical protein